MCGTRSIRRHLTRKKVMHRKSLWLLFQKLHQHRGTELHVAYKSTIVRFYFNIQIMQMGSDRYVHCMSSKTSFI